MALDGIMLSLICDELKEILVNGKTDKITQPDRDMLVFSFRTQKGNKKLLLSASAASARICLTEKTYENPLTPPMFCMLMRKHLTSSKLINVETLARERIVIFTFECFNEFGDKVTRRLAVEIMGKHSNIILIDENGIITDSVKRIDFTTSSVRQILPGLRYEYPPMQDKLDPLGTDIEALVCAIVSHRDMSLDKAILQSIQGFSPVVCREIAYQSLRGDIKDICDMNEDEIIKLKVILKRLLSEPKTPCLVLDKDGKRPIEFSFTEIHQYGTAGITKILSSFSELVDTAFEQKAKADTQKRKQDDVLRILSTSCERISRKLAAQKSDLALCADKDKYRKYGDLISSNIWQIEKGAASCTLEDYFDGGKITIPLDVMLSPAQNAQRYYKKYRKADTAEKMLTKQIEDSENELKYIDTVFDELTRAETLTEIAEIREELIQSGYARAVKSGKPLKQKESLPNSFITDDGITVLCGRNNVQNDKLTLKTAQNGFIWLHVKNIPGCHTVIMENADNVPERTLIQAAVLAATFSKAADSNQVPVDYTLIKHVHKPSGAKPGMVIYTNQKTLFVSPDNGLAERLKNRC